MTTETLESRQLFSSWSTVALGSSDYGSIMGMAADTVGNVYAVGHTRSITGTDAGVLWKKSASGVDWVPLATLPHYNSGQAIAVDANGNIFVTGRSGPTNNSFATFELPSGASAFTTIDTDTNGAGCGQAVSVDAAGNVYAVGYDSLKIQGNSNHHWTVRKGTFANGMWSFSTVDEPAYKIMDDSAHGVAVTPGGIYVAGYYDYYWTVRYSATGASGTWTTVDSFRMDATSNAASQANAIGTDALGHLYVGGFGQTAVKSGKSYTYTPYWIVRESDSGAAGSWSTIDNGKNWAATDPAARYAHTAPVAICRDSAGNIDVAGNGLIRTRSVAGGSWTNSVIPSTSSGNTYLDYKLTIDSFGNLYGGGEAYDDADTFDDFFIGSQPAALTNLTASPDPTSPSSQINLSWTNNAAGDSTGLAIYRSIDGINFTLLTTVGAGISNFTDSGLTSGTTYCYFVVTLLNADGSSAPSGTARATTSV